MVHKAANHGGTLSREVRDKAKDGTRRRPRRDNDYMDPRGRKTLRDPERRRHVQLNLLGRGEGGGGASRTAGRGGMYDDDTSESASQAATTTTYQTASDLQAIEAEALAVTQKWVRTVPPVYKGNPGWVNKPISEEAPSRGAGQQRPPRQLICWKCYSRGHISSNCRLDFESQAPKVIANFENLTLKEKGQVPDTHCGYR